jgi:hypothetical protein
VLGSNQGGQLGDGTTTSRTTPVNVVGLGLSATLSVASQAVAVTRGRLAGIPLRCGSQADCRGTLALSAYASGKVAGSAARRVQLDLGRRRFALAAGEERKVDVVVSLRGFRVLTRMRRMTARAWVSYRHPGGGTTARTAAITLVAP